MMEMIVVLIFILWYGLSLFLSESYGKNHKPGVEYLFFISMIFSTLTAFLLIILTKKKHTIKIKSELSNL
jgi:hypothetical protein